MPAYYTNHLTNDHRVELEDSASPTIFLRYLPTDYYLLRDIVITMKQHSVDNRRMLEDVLSAYFEVNSTKFYMNNTYLQSVYDRGKLSNIMEFIVNRKFIV